MPASSSTTPAAAAGPSYCVSSTASGSSSLLKKKNVVDQQQQSMAAKQPPMAGAKVKGMASTPLTDPRKSKISATTPTNSAAVSKSQLETGHRQERAPQVSASASSSTSSSKQPSPPIVLTTSGPMIQKAKNDLRKNVDETTFEQLQQRMEVRKMIMDGLPIGGDGEKPVLKPFDPKGLNPCQVVQQRAAAHAELSTDAGDFMVQLLNADAQYEKLKKRKFKAKRIYTPMVGTLNQKQGESIKVEELADLQERRDLPILNLNRFITATDRRTPIYDANDNCLFCQTHGIHNSGRHDTAGEECPYTFCACVSCYLNAGLSGAQLQQ